MARLLAREKLTIRLEGEDYVFGEAAIGAVGWMQFEMLTRSAMAMMIESGCVAILRGSIEGMLLSRITL